MKRHVCNPSPQYACLSACSMKILYLHFSCKETQLIVATIGSSTDAKKHLHSPLLHYFFRLLYIIDRKLWKVMQKKGIKYNYLPMGVCIFAHFRIIIVNENLLATKFTQNPEKISICMIISFKQLNVAFLRNIHNIYIIM